MPRHYRPHPQRYAPTVRREGAFAIIAHDLRKKLRERPANALVIFVVDASDSLGSTPRMAVAKGAVLDLLTAAYQKRQRVGLIAFRAKDAKVLLPPTSSVALANECLRDLARSGVLDPRGGISRPADAPTAHTPP